jgi:hypothetical protein
MTSSSKSRVVKYSHLGMEVRAGSRHSGSHPHVEAICGMPEVLEHSYSEEASLGFPGSRARIHGQESTHRDDAQPQWGRRNGSCDRKTSDGVDSREVRRFGLAAVQHAHGNKPLSTVSHRLYQANYRKLSVRMRGSVNFRCHWHIDCARTFKKLKVNCYD